MHIMRVARICIALMAVAGIFLIGTIIGSPVTLGPAHG